MFSRVSDSIYHPASEDEVRAGDRLPLATEQAKSPSSGSKSSTPRRSISGSSTSLPSSSPFLPFNASTPPSCRRASGHSQELTPCPTRFAPSFGDDSPFFGNVSDEALAGVLFSFDDSDDNVSGDGYSSDADDSSWASGKGVSPPGSPSPGPAHESPLTHLISGDDARTPVAIGSEHEQLMSSMGLPPPSTPARTPLSQLFEYTCTRSLPLSAKSSTTPSSQPEHTAGVIDYISFPHIFDAILRRCNSDALVLLRGACHSVQTIVDLWLYRHVEIFAADDGISLDVYSRGSSPRLRSTMVNPAAFSRTRAIDLYGDLPPDAFECFAKNLQNIETVRLFPDGRGRCVAKCPVRTQNLVIVGEPRMPKTDPGADCVVMQSLLKRVIVHIEGLDDTNGLWYHQLLYPYGTREVVFVFTDWKKPFTPKAAARGGAVRRRDTGLAHARFQLLRNAIEHLITKYERRHGYAKCTVVDIDAIDTDWFGLPACFPLARHLHDEVLQGLGRWRSHEEAEFAASYLQFMSAAQWQASLIAEDAS